MALRNLLEIDERELRQLRPFVEDETLYVAVHTGWKPFFCIGNKFDDTQCIVSQFVDAELNQAKKHMCKSTSYKDVPFRQTILFFRACRR